MGEARDDRGDRRRGMGKRMKRTKPPFRADHVGSLLRPAALKEARAKRAKGEMSAADLKADRGPRDRARHPQAGGGRPAGGHRRRIPPLLVASRFSLGPRRRRAARDGHGRCVRGRQHARRGHQGHRQGRIFRPSDDRALQVRGRPHQGHAEDHDSGALRDLRPPDGDADRQGDLSETSTRSSTMSARPTARRCAPSRTRAAAICSSTKCSSRCCATRNIASRCATAATIRKSSARSTAT